MVIRESYLSYLITIGVSVGPPFSSSSRSTACAMMIIFHLIDDVMMIILYLSMSSCCCRDDVVREKLQFCVEIPPGVLEQRGHEKDLPEKKDLFFTGGQVTTLTWSSSHHEVHEVYLCLCGLHKKNCYASLRFVLLRQRHHRVGR